MSVLDLTPTPGGRFRINPCDRIEWFDAKTRGYLIVCDQDAIALRDLLNRAYPADRDVNLMPEDEFAQRVRWRFAFALGLARNQR